MKSIPFVAIVGRPNVGKSSLFNRLAKSRQAIVHDQPGVTRDRHYVTLERQGRRFTLIDTGGFDPAGEDRFAVAIAEQVRAALAECDAIVGVFDATSEPMAQDRSVMDLLRHTAKPFLCVINKADSTARQHQAAGYYRLGMPQLLTVSAAHGLGMEELEKAIANLLPPEPDSEPEPEEPSTETPRLAIVGKPNAGKSSLVNLLLGKSQQLVHEHPGTTIDSVDVEVSIARQPWRITDTAGMRRRAAVVPGIEWVSVLQAMRSIERSQLALLLIDAAAGASEQDAKIAGLVLERHRGLVVALNKIELLSAKEQRLAVDHARDVLAFASWAPILPISVAARRGIAKLGATLASCRDAYHHRVSTGELNRFFADILLRHPPPTASGRSVRLLYCTQAEASPPLFFVASNRPQDVHFSYQRYVVNQLRKRFGFAGTPIRVVYRGRTRDEQGSTRRPKPKR